MSSFPGLWKGRAKSLRKCRSLKKAEVLGRNLPPRLFQHTTVENAYQQIGPKPGA